MYINGKATAENTNDAVVIGSDISGGRAAKELCEKELKTLVLERRRMVEHIKDYMTATMHPWEFKRMTISGYFSSEIGMTEALNYLPLLGKFEACIPYNQGDKPSAT